MSPASALTSGRARKSRFSFSARLAYCFDVLSFSMKPGAKRSNSARIGWSGSARTSSSSEPAEATIFFSR